MRRRDFITLIGGAAAWPFAARAQHAARLPVIGYLGANTHSAENRRIAAFVQRLRELGWIEGQTIAIEVRWAEGRNERFAEIAAEFCRLGCTLYRGRSARNHKPDAHQHSALGARLPTMHGQ